MFFFSSRRRHTRSKRDWSSDVCSSDLVEEFEKAGRKTILFPGIDLVGRVLSSGQPAWIDNVVDDKNFPRATIAERVGLHGAFAFPIRVGDHVQCVMAFYKREVVQLDDEMLQMFDALGRQVGDFIKR